MQELYEALGDSTEIPWFEQLKKLPYLDAVINESLRKSLSRQGKERN